MTISASDLEEVKRVLIRCAQATTDDDLELREQVNDAVGLISDALRRKDDA